MKKLVGLVIVLLSIAFFTLLILRIWGVSVVSWQNIVRSGATFVLLGALIVILIIIYFLFFKKSAKQDYRQAGK